jgi:hypothetical protein
VGDMLSGGIAMGNVQIFLEAFWNVTLGPACFAVEAFSGKKQNFNLGDHSPKVADYQGFFICRT